MPKTISQIYAVGQAAIDAHFANKIEEVADGPGLHKMADYHVITLLEELGFCRTVAAWRSADIRSKHTGGARNG